MFLTDAQLVEMLEQAQVVTGVPKPADWYSAESPTQPCSLDLHVGEIHLPPDSPDSTPSAAGDTATLHTGETAVIETAEHLHMPDDTCAIGFSPSHVAAKGLLMTNPGHVDPGFDGKLSFTVINMGREHFQLRTGDAIFTLLFCRLQANAHRAYSVRRTQRPDRSISFLRRLSRDFLDVERRATEIAEKVSKEAGQAVKIRTAIIGAIAAICVGLVTAFGPWYWGNQARLNNLEREVAAVKSKHNLLHLQERVRRLEAASDGNATGQTTTSP